MPEGLFEFLVQTVKVHGHTFTPCNDIQINWGKKNAEVSEYLPYTAFKPVSNYRAADLLAGGYPQTCMLVAVCLPNDKYPLRRKLVRGIGKPEKFSPFSQSERGGE